MESEYVSIDDSSTPLGCRNQNSLQRIKYAAQLGVDMREYEQAEALVARALDLSEQHQFSNPAAWSRCVLGQARAQLGRATEGIALIRHGIDGLREIGTLLNISAFTAYLAEAQERAGAIVDALETVEQALQANPDELFYRPETLKLRGELRLKIGQTEPAESDFREAIVLAQKMSAKAWELRATMSLARLLAKQGRATKRARCSPKSTAGSPRASTLPT